jgi:hypothetical protein
MEKIFSWRKWRPQALVFVFGFLAIFTLMALGIGEDVIDLDFTWTALIFFSGGLVGWAMEVLWLRSSGVFKSILSLIGLLAFCVFWSLIFLILGSILGGNELLQVSFAGLEGYESAGLLGGIFGGGFSAVLGFWLLGLNKGREAKVLICALASILADVFLAQSGIAPSNIVFLGFFLPSLVIWGLSLRQN